MTNRGVDIAMDSSSRRGAPERAHAGISAMINLRRVKPGERLPSATVLAAEIGVSRPAVLQALQRLQAEGRVLVGTGRAGTVVVGGPDADPEARLDEVRAKADTIRQLAVFRRALEPGIAELAARQGMSLDDLREARSLVRAMRSAPDPATFLELDADFHHVLARMLGERVVGALALVGRRGVGEAFDVLDLTPEQQRAANEQHARLLSAVARRDAEAARAEAAAHVDATNRLIEAVLSDDGDGAASAERDENRRSRNRRTG